MSKDQMIASEWTVKFGAGVAKFSARDCVRKPGGRWFAAVAMAGVITSARRFRSLSHARRWANGQRDTCRRIPKTIVRVGRFHAEDWRRVSHWERAMQSASSAPWTWAVATCHFDAHEVHRLGVVSPGARALEDGIRATASLWRNFAIAGALCAAFSLGLMSCSCDRMPSHRDWYPGCGWPVGEGEHADCVLCGEGSRHYLHSPEPYEDA